ncbi:MAG: DUF177 domain-containing protein [Pseudomonadota bacterium]
MTAFSHIIDPDKIGGTTKRIELRPTDEQKAEIANRLNLIELKELQADIELKWEKGGTTLRLSGDLVAHAVQQCVVSLGPVDEKIDYPFVERYSAEDEAGEGEIVVSADEEADIDQLPEDGLDVAEIAIQHLSLALDPYPRAPGAEAQGPNQVGPVESESDRRPNPFARLSVLKGGKN